MYVEDHNHQYPYSYSSQDGLPGSTIFWYHALQPYYVIDFTTNRALHCPGYKGRVDGVVTPNSAVAAVSYGYNGWGALPDDPPRGLGGVSNPVSLQNDRPVSETQVKVPSEMFAI